MHGGEKRERSGCCVIVLAFKNLTRYGVNSFEAWEFINFENFPILKNHWLTWYGILTAQCEQKKHRSQSKVQLQHIKYELVYSSMTALERVLTDIIK